MECIRINVKNDLNIANYVNLLDESFVFCFHVWWEELLMMGPLNDKPVGDQTLLNNCRSKSEKVARC